MAETHTNGNGKGNGNKWWKVSFSNILWFIMVSLVTWMVWSTRRSDSLVRQADFNSARISKLEVNVDEMLKNQPMRDYILGVLARRAGVEVPRAFGVQPAYEEQQ